MPAKAFEAAVACAIQDSLTRAAERHEVIIAKDVVVVQDASARAHSLAARIEREGIRQAAPLIDRGTIRKDRLGITLCAAALSNALELQVDELTPALLRIKAPFHCRRRGAEMKIIAGSFQPVPDKTMIRALRNAHAWVRQMKAGASIREVMMQANKSDSYVSRIMLLAFLAPRIQKAIIDGTQPVSLTLETLIRSRMPRDWNAQEVLFGFDAKS
ncbi:hypothetical protein C1J05_04100 [Sulfitobacter sp. JL08]|uniref:hypothetical protein n=1 Tax=Sulfitobacter sp. JL08 TaxID=2070369 RepID=UPI000E0B1B8A|nr:hypothetical protein [Sulfitobacter sp. JL08]AXI53791.1 hypothetical protein C1J05_04100 [Sulfitobacter sp. JL08]